MSITERQWKGRRVTVAGLGSFGGQAAVARYFSSLGAIVTITDTKPASELTRGLADIGDLGVRQVLGGHEVADFVEADLIVASPAMPRTSPFLLAAEAAGVPVTHEMDLFFELCRAHIIGVTGSNGKSTTAALLAHILRGHFESPSSRPHRRVWLGGNIGRSLLLEAPRIAQHDIVVLELSSFQLESLAALSVSPQGAVVTNISPNHLDRHGTFEDYVRSKRCIARYQRQGDFLVLNADDNILKGWRETPARVVFFGSDESCGEKGVFVCGRNIVSINENTREEADVPAGWRLIGPHNLQNLAAACAAASCMGVALSEAAHEAGGFEGLPHRLEYVGTTGGVKFYNDSIATTPEAASAALGSFAEPVVLIAGGYDKGADMAAFAQTAAHAAKALVVMGDTARAIAGAAARAGTGIEIICANGLGDAVRKAFALAGPGAAVVLSPACASYDMFSNFQERGEAFAEEVARLVNSDTGESS